MLNTKQISVIGLVIVLMGALLALDVKSLVKPQKESASEAPKKNADFSNVTLENVSENAKKTLNANLAQQLTDLENKLKNASDDAKLNLQKQLAQKWNDVNIPAPSAFYIELIAQADESFSNWMRAGDAFTNAYQATQDTLVRPAFIQKAIFAYQKAEKLDPNSVDTKIGLGVAYVSGTPDPMKGIALLLDVVKQDPDNVKANMSLGLFSMKSGQYQKAINRFKVVVSQTNMPEAWFYLAMSYENIGMKQDAILAYKKAKELAADPSLGKFVDRKVEELKK